MIKRNQDGSFNSNSFHAACRPLVKKFMLEGKSYFDAYEQARLIVLEQDKKESGINLK